MPAYIAATGAIAYAHPVNNDETATVQKLISELDAAVPKEGARVRLCQYGGGADESRVTATRQGYLRLGVEFLRAAYAAPSGDAPTQIRVDLDYLLTEDSDIGFDWFERVESLPGPDSTSSGSSFWAAVFGIAAGVCFLIFLLVGFVTVIRWLFH